MKFEWDENKNTINKVKHKISFETASLVFNYPNYIEMYDFEHSTEENRFVAVIGKNCDQCRKGIILCSRHILLNRTKN